LARTFVIDKKDKGLSYGSEAILVSGGLGAMDNNGVSLTADAVELILPKTGQFCSLPRLPFGLDSHSMDGLYLCGGTKVGGPTGERNLNCLNFSDGQWSLSASLQIGRSEHSSWQTDNGIFLIGGTRGLVESEFIPSDGEPGYMAFPIQYETMSSCAITDVESHSVVIAGGLFVEGGISNSDKVARYDEGGFVGDMPSLLVARHRHGCGSFFRDDGSQVLMVAGGLLADQFTSISSTEMLAPGSDSWTLATPLPSARTGLVGVTVDNRLYMTGGSSGGASSEVTDEILEWRDEEEAWGLGVWMELARTYHRASSVTIDENIMKYCT